MSLKQAAASYIYTHYALKKKRKERRWWQAQLYTSREVYSGSSLLADLNFQSVSRLYENFSQWIWIFNSLDWRKNLEKGQSVQENHFCSRKAGNDATFLGKWWFVPAVPVQNFQECYQLHRSESVWSFFEKLKDHIQIRQILLFVVYGRSLKLDFNQKFYFNTTFTATFLLKKRPNYAKGPCTSILISSSEDFVAGQMLSVGKLETKVSYCTDWMVTEKGSENGEMKEKCAEEEWYFEGTR